MDQETCHSAKMESYSQWSVSFTGTFELYIKLNLVELSIIPSCFTDTVYKAINESDILVLKEPIWALDPSLTGNKSSGNVKSGRGNHILASVVVLSAPGNFKTRMEARENFAKSLQKLEVKHRGMFIQTFLLGTTKNKKYQALIDEEAKKYGDILQVLVNIS